MDNVDTEFAKRIHSLINENVLQYGTQLTPVVQANFPSTETPSTDQMNVTTGETKPLGEPREDLQAQQQGFVQPNEEVMAEVSSLLISIGFILSKDGCIPDKFNTAATLAFLNKHFPQNANVPCDVDQPPQQPEGGLIPSANPLMESRQILVKHWTKK